MSDPKDLIRILLASLTFPDVELDIKETEEALEIYLTLPQEESGLLIGYRGEKIDALQLITSLMVNLDRIKYLPVKLDINGYRQRRHESLEILADKAAHNAIDSGREILLPPLPPHERRHVHLYLEQNPGVTTYSEGDGPSRRVVVRPTSPSSEDSA